MTQRPAQAHALAPDGPAAVRRRIRDGRHRGPTAGLAPGRLQANLVVLPTAMARDFRRYCERNPRPCPLLAMSEPGRPHLPSLGADLDLRTDLPRYRVWRDGASAGTVEDARALWRRDLVAFALGCSFSFEEALMAAGVPVRHVAAGRNVAMYVTDRATVPAGAFAGPLVVSLRGLPPGDVARAAAISARMPLAHGAPVHVGDPAALGIADIHAPEFGDPPVLAAGDVPVFWACGVTPQMALRAARPPFAITHEPGHMLVTDLLAEPGTPP